MSLSVGLTGIQAAQNLIDTVGNNIANVNTTGFKLSNASFSDLYVDGATSLPGQGVKTASPAQSFATGTLQQTGNPLDVAINGNGFFQMQTASGIVYGRDGEFQIDQNGYLSTASGGQVLGFPPSPSGTGSTSGVLGPIQVSTASIGGAATTTLGLNLNLPTGDTPIDTTAHAFSISDAGSYNESTSTAVYDSLGTANSLTTYYTAVSGSGSPPRWDTHWALTSPDGGLIASGAGPSLTFNSSGKLVSGAGTISASGLPDGAANLNIAVDYNGSGLSNLEFGVTSVTNDGSGSGNFSGVTIRADGQVIGNYTNGGTKVFGTVALANFADPQGLVPLTGNVWAPSTTSGQPIAGAPGTAAFGQLQSGALEGSNVDLTSQLVNLIVAQQAYQANVQGISIEQQNFQKLISL